MKFHWEGIGAGPTQSMGVVDRENIVALLSMGWKIAKPEQAEVIFSFAHQGRSDPDTSGKIRIFYLCTTYHNSIVGNYVEYYKRIAATPKNYIFVLNKEMQNTFKLAGVKAYVWNHGVNSSHFRRGYKGDNIMTLGFVGQGDTGKRHGFLAKCFLKAQERLGIEARLKLVTGWGHVEGLDSKPPQIELVKGFDRQDIGAFYQSLDWHVTFSSGEGFNLTPLEALACGTPCLVTDMPSMQEKPYDKYCRHVKATKRIKPEWLIDQHFSPRDVNLYHSPPYLYEIAEEDGVEALMQIMKMRYRTNITEDCSWQARIREQVLPIIT